MTMTNEKVSEVLDRYQRMLTEFHQDRDRCPAEMMGIVAHQLRMIPKIREILEEIRANAIDLPMASPLVAAKRERLMRMLGFLQGSMWVEKLVSVDEVRAHNMSAAEAKRLFPGMGSVEQT